MQFRFLHIICVVLFLIAGCKREEEQVIASKVKVNVANLSERMFVKQIRVQGNIQPVNSATIAARVSGIIEDLKAQEGDFVKKNDILFQTDKDNLENLVLSARQSLKVAEESAKMISEDIFIAEITLKKATADYQRAVKLEKANVMSKNDFEEVEADYNRAQATLRRTNAVLNYTKTQVSQRQVELKIAEKNLADSIIRAPYDGVITERFREEGEFAIVGSKVLKLEQQRELELTARISSIYYSNLSTQTKIIISANNKKLCQTHLSYISPSVSPLSRTFEIKALLPNQRNLVSGTLCDIDIILAERKGYGIDFNAVMPQAQNKNILFAVEDNRAKAIAVDTGFSTDGYMEILNGENLKSAQFVVSGNYFLNDGDEVEIIAE